MTAHFQVSLYYTVGVNREPSLFPLQIGFNMAMTQAEKRKAAVKRAGVSGINKPKRTPDHPKKSHIVVTTKPNGDPLTIRFGEKGASTAGKPKAGESDRMKKKRASFKARHSKNIKKGKTSAAYWADKVKW